MNIVMDFSKGEASIGQNGLAKDRIVICTISKRPTPHLLASSKQLIVEGEWKSECFQQFP
jgi:hypothetical protein